MQNDLSACVKKRIYINPRFQSWEFRKTNCVINRFNGFYSIHIFS